MERASKKAEIIPNVQYSSMLLVTILASIGFCCAILKALPLNPDTGWDNEGQNFTNAIMRLCLSCLFFYLIVCVVWTIKNREILHRRQLVFWPMRCQHCARAVGLISQQSRGQSTDGPRETSQRYMARRRSLPILPSTCSIGNTSLEPTESIVSNHEQTAQTVNDISSDTQSVSGNLEALSQTESFRSPTSDIQVENTSLLKSFAYKRPHKSLLVLYNVFGTIALLTVPLKIIGVIICLLTESHASEAPMKLNFNLVCEGVFDLLLVIGLACNLAFFNIFYDAVFLQTGIFPTFIGAYLASGLGLLALNLVYPLGVVVEPSHDPLLFSCELPKPFIEFMYNNALLVTPLYTDIGLIGVSILWKIWVSILPQSCLKVTSSDEADFEHFHRPCRISISAYIKTLLQSFKKLITRRRYFGVCHIFLSSVISVATFFLFDRFVVSRKSFNLSEITRTYILWFCNMIGYLPFIALYRYQLFLSGNLGTFRLKDYISFQHGLVGSHDVILMIGCSGMFMANVFRLVASAGILFGHDGPLLADLLSLECFGLIYYVSQIYVVSSTTSFLLIIHTVRPLRKISAA